MPSLSICIPAYKAERYLAETLASVRAQTFTDWEVILVEDGSHDGTEEIFATFAAGGAQRSIFHRHAQNQGLPATRNTGIGLAAAEWIVLLDSDDVWRPNHLAELVACAKRRPEAELAHAGSVLFDSETGREFEVRAPTPAVVSAYPESLFLGDYIIQPSSVMLKRSLWERVGKFDPTFRHVEDREMWMRCAQAEAKFTYTGSNTCLYRKHSAALSTQSALMAVAAARVFDKALNWKAIPETVRRRNAASAWLAAGRIELRKNPRAASEAFDRAWQHRRSPQLLIYRMAAKTLAWLK